MGLPENPMAPQEGFLEGKAEGLRAAFLPPWGAARLKSEPREGASGKVLGTQRQTRQTQHRARSPSGEAKAAQTIMNNALNNDKQAEGWEGRSQGPDLCRGHRTAFRGGVPEDQGWLTR